MNSFINKTVKNITEQNDSFEDIIFVVPSKRSILFLIKELKKNIKNGFLPKIITIQEFIDIYNDKSLISNIPIWLTAFKVYKQIFPQQELHDFLKWIPNVLNDFKDIENFAENPIQVIDYLISIERIENWGINFSELENYESANKTIVFWQRLKTLYINLNEYLTNNELISKGNRLNFAFESIKQNINNINNFYYFIGFNALLPKEEMIIKFLLKNKKADIFFDSDEYYLNDLRQEAGFFIRKYKNWNYFFGKEFNFIDYKLNDNNKIIKKYPSNNYIIQAKVLAMILKEIPLKDYEKTAIVLCDDNILLPVLESIPDFIENINITMEFSISKTSYSLFFIKILELRNKIEKNPSQGIYIIDLEEIIQNNILPKDIQQFGLQCINDLKEKSNFFVTLNYLQNYFKNNYLEFIFKDYNFSTEILDEFVIFLSLLQEKSNKNIVISKIILGMNNLFVSFSRIISNFDKLKDFESFYFIFKHLITQEKLSFIGEPLKGIQILGLLETRLISFKNIILLSVNEGVIPLGTNDNSFIPFDVKRKFNINTFLENDSIYAYYFYRLIQHSENIHLVYDEDQGNFKEQSRFITQLEIESNHKIETIRFDYKHKNNPKEIISIQKDNFIINKLEKWLLRGISPSSISLYLYNPIDFYFKYILEINQQQEIETEINNQKIGSLIHKVLENLYIKYLGKPLNLNDFKEIKSNINKELLNQIKKENIQQIDSGINFLNIEISRKTIEKIINYDENLVKESNELIIHYLEKRFEIDYKIKQEKNQNKQTKFVGIIDRIDSLNGIYRIIDYKSTAKTNGYSLKIKEDFIFDENHNHIIQLIIYCYFILNDFNMNKIQTGIWGFNNPNKGVQYLQTEIEKNKYNNVITKEIITDFVPYLDILLNEILNPEVNFISKK